MTALALQHPVSAHSDIVQGLLQRPASISPKYFYDEHGSELFEAITRLSEYYPTRTEYEVMQRHGQDIAESVGQGGTVIELGAGSCEKARTLCALLRPERFVGVDISADFLRGAVARLQGALPWLRVDAVAGDLTRPVALPQDIPRARRLVFYPGSSIGNFDPPQALALLARMRALVDADGGVLIGFDLPKDLAVLEAAYDDAAGVTAAFNRNALAHVNQLIGSDFVPEEWEHRAFFDRRHSRIEMHLETARGTRVRWPGGSRVFAPGERIHTENSYKYTLPAFQAMLARAGFSRARAWTDERGWFAVVHARP
ncbi:L-histidine N(alpha)-methyltransferase [Acidovorax sp. GBBC 3334]|uniref:L-histidine N(alpha)-methyltransferase n=1 Tax=Acidovorax sp. GBBC 3334 TaxID=2940496 RepID=UPI0023035282|nr:L-histidine N(alpha)-methyltransferase [Acidovorax sp. GBBC 3334]MDA8453351.1 L-histidine N(alpha)-methyltransferase [Acidovorax sp. GBBC 3334]